MTKKNVVGIDPSLTGTAVYRSDGHSTEFGSKSAKTIAGRVKRYSGLVSKVLEAIGEKPEQIMIEGYLARMTGSALSLVEYGWQLRLDILRLWPDVSIIEVPATSLKKFTTGKGNADKAAMVSSVTLKAGIPFTSDNLADAYALMRMGLVVAGREKATNKPQRDVLAKLGIG